MGSLGMADGPPKPQASGLQAHSQAMQGAAVCRIPAPEGVPAIVQQLLTARKPVAAGSAHCPAPVLCLQRKLPTVNATEQLQ